MPKTVHRINFSSLEEDDLVVKWLDETGFWDEGVRLRCGRAGKKFPADLMSRFREEFGLPLTDGPLKLFRMLMKAGKNGVELKVIGHTPESWREPDTCCGKLNHLKLVYVRDGFLFLLTIAQDHRVRYLIGARRSV